MQPQNGQLSPGFITIDEAINLINKDTRDKATVDLAWMANNIDYINEFKNFQIPLMESDEKGYAHKKGKAYVYVATAYEKETLKHAIRTAYKNRTGRDANVDAVHDRTTVYDPEHNTTAHIKSSPNPNTQKGEGLPTTGEVK